MVTVVEPYHGKLISASEDRSLRIWNLGDSEYGELVRTIWVSYLALKSLCVLPGQRAACGSTDMFLRVISLETGEILHKIDEHATKGPESNFWQEEGCGMVLGLLHLRENILASCGDDTTVRFWDIDTARCLGVHVGHLGYGKDIKSKYRFSQTYAPVFRLLHLGDGGDHIASASYDRMIAIWDVSDLESVRVVRRLKGHGNSVTNLCLLEKGILASCSGDFTCKIWNFETGECLHTIQTHGHPTCAVRLDSNRMAIGGGDASIRVYDWRNGKDLMGPRGFFAHEFIINWMTRFYEEDSESQWLEPMMYRTTHPLSSAWEATYAPEFQANMTVDALRWGTYD